LAQFLHPHHFHFEQYFVQIWPLHTLLHDCVAAAQDSYPAAPPVHAVAHAVMSDA
jgi:hypothetical protein